MMFFTAVKFIGLKLLHDDILASQSNTMFTRAYVSHTCTPYQCVRVNIIIRLFWPTDNAIEHKTTKTAETTRRYIDSAVRLRHWSYRTPSSAVLMMLQGGFQQTSFRQPRPRNIHRLWFLNEHPTCLCLLRCTESATKCSPVRSQSVLQSLVTSLVLTRLDYGNATLAGILLYLLKRLQSVVNSTARLVFSSSLYDHVSQLYWLMARERIDFKLVLLVYKCQYGARPSYLADELSQPADLKGRRHLRSASSPSLIVRRTRLSTISDWAFLSPLFAFGTVCRSMSRLHHHCLSRSRMKTDLFRRCFSWL